MINQIRDLREYFAQLCCPVNWKLKDASLNSDHMCVHLTVFVFFISRLLQWNVVYNNEPRPQTFIDPVNQNTIMP